MATEQPIEGGVVPKKTEGWTSRKFSRRTLIRGAVAVGATAAIGVTVGIGGRKLLSGGEAESGIKEAKEQIPGAGSEISEAASPTPEPTAKPEPTPIPRYKTVFIPPEGNVPDQLESAIKKGAELAEEYYYDQLGISVPAKYRIFNDPNSKIARGQSTGRDFMVEYNTARLNVLHSDNEIQGSTHEYFHLIQELFPGVRIPNFTPVWLAEGTAEYAGYRVLIDNGLADYQSVKQGRLAVVKRGPREVALDLNYQGGYDFSFLAIDFLLNGGEIKPLLELFRNINEVFLVAARRPWSTLSQRDENYKEGFREAFFKARGETLDSFSNRFEEYRKKNSF